MGGKSSGGDTTTTVRYAKYIEDAHKLLITQAQDYGDALIGTSPYSSFTVNDPDNAFFGVGYVITDFPSQFDMFGKFLAGLDIESLYNQELTDSIYGVPVNDAVSAEAAYLDDEIDTVSLPRMETGMRDMNAVMTSTFLINRELIEADRVKAINKYQATLEMHTMDLGHDRWAKHLTWNNQVIEAYMKMFQLYTASKGDYVNVQTEIESREALWPFTVLDHERVIVACLQGATNSTTKGHESKTARAVSGALGGAAMGSVLAGASNGAITGPVGAIAGGLLGLAGGLFG